MRKPADSDSERAHLAAGSPSVETVLDRLADALFATDEVIGMLQNSQERRLDWMEPRIAEIYDTVNDLMKHLSP